MKCASCAVRIVTHLEASRPHHTETLYVSIPGCEIVRALFVNIDD
jgi:hypothetical protein